MSKVELLMEFRFIRYYGVIGCGTWMSQDGHRSQAKRGHARRPQAALIGLHHPVGQVLTQPVIGCLCLRSVKTKGRRRTRARCTGRARLARNEIPGSQAGGRCLCTRRARLKALCSQPNGARMHPMGQVGVPSLNQSRPRIIPRCCRNCAGIADDLE